MLLILEAASITGVGSMKRKQELLITTVDQKKEDMSNKAKTEVLKKLNNFKVQNPNNLDMHSLWQRLKSNKSFLFLCAGVHNGLSQIKIKDRNRTLTEPNQQKRMEG